MERVDDQTINHSNFIYHFTGSGLLLREDKHSDNITFSKGFQQLEPGFSSAISNFFLSQTPCPEQVDFISPPGSCPLVFNCFCNGIFVC